MDIAEDKEGHFPKYIGNIISQRYVMVISLLYCTSTFMLSQNVVMWGFQKGIFMGF